MITKNTKLKLKGKRDHQKRKPTKARDEIKTNQGNCARTTMRREFSSIFPRHSIFTKIP
jgi:hypothetical protein